MKNVKLKQFLLVFMVFSLKEGNGDRTRDRMYDEIRGASACFRRMNATHQTGCSSDRQGSTGIVHLIDQLDDLKTLIQKGTGGSYVPVLPADLLDEDSATLLRSSAKIAGLVVYKRNDTVEPSRRYTHENKCPNREFALENTCDVEWNKGGTDILNENFGFPVFYVANESDFLNVRDCFYRFNNVSIESHNERSLCSLELSSFMLAAIDTPTCLRRSSPFFNLNTVKLCDPLGSNNIWSTLFPVGNSTLMSDSETAVRRDMKYIIVTARMDTTSLFIDQEKGAINPITSMVTLLYTAKSLKTILPSYAKSHAKNVMFLLLSGETYDYIGSQRLMYDLNEGQFPTADFKDENETVFALRPEDIHLVVELNQISKVDTMFAHVYEEKPAIREFVTKLKKYGRGVGVNDTVGRLPPSSMQTFAKSNVSGLVLTDHEGEYANRFYNSMFDDADNLDYEYFEDPDDIPPDSIQAHVADVGEMVSKSLYEEVTGESPPKDFPRDVALVDELFNCYLRNASCRIHHAVGKKKLKETPMGLYVGVSISRSVLVAYVGLTLSWLTGDVINDTAPCPPRTNSYIYKYYNMSKSLADLNKTVCYRSCMNFTEAVSPAFIIKDYDWSSNEYSSWTESVWRELSVRLFLRPSPGHEKMTFAIGSMVMALSFIFVYFVSSRSHVLFPVAESTAPTRC